MISIATLGMFSPAVIKEEPALGGMMPPSYRVTQISEGVKVNVSSVSEEDHEQIINIKVVSLTEGES